MMNSALLVINCGSSSLKFALYEANNFNLIVSGLAEQLNGPESRISYKHIQSSQDAVKSEDSTPNLSHLTALEKVASYLSQSCPNVSVVAIGHRVVHGGESFKQSVLIDSQVVEQIEQCSELAPLHNPANLTGIQLCEKLFPGIPQVAVFDTAFHQTLSPVAYLYPVKYQLYEDYGVRRYGFHGSSHRFVSAKAAEVLEESSDTLNLITIHLGNGCSLCAVSGGKSVDTSMGLTPLEGLMMGTRSGDVDPGLFKFLSSKGWDIAQIDNMLNKESGLLGISRLSNDMRTLCDAAENGNEKAQLAIDMFCYRLAKHIASHCVALPKLDALVFTGGIGENSALIRANVLQRLSFLGVNVHHERNQVHGTVSNGRISDDQSTAVLVIATNEELMIAQDTWQLINN